jgi:cytidine deaminase
LSVLNKWKMKKKSLKIDYILFDSADELDKETSELIKAAGNAMSRAYAPYSNFKVGAALRLDDHSIVEGNNQENSAYPSGLCAERVALFYAGAQFPEKMVKDIAVVASSFKNPRFSEIVTPCGGCRQVMLETQSRQNKKIRIILTSMDGKGIIFESVNDIIPFSFDLSSLLSAK